MSQSKNTPKSGDPIDSDVEKALLAAFGEDAIGWLDEDDEMDFSSMEISEEANAEMDGPSESPLSELLEQISSAIDGSPDTEQDLDPFGALDDEDDEVVDLGPRYVVFEVGDQQYGVPLDGVLEIDRCGKVTSLPRTPNWLRGVTNLRGRILSVTDFRNLIGLADQRRTVGEKIIVVHSERQDARTALVVDRVLGIRNLRGEQGPLEGLSDRLAVFADSLAVNEQATTVLIDPERLLGCNELASFSTE